MTPIIYLLDSPPCVHAPSIRKAAGLCFKGLTGKWEREENLSWSYSNLLLHVWSERSDVRTTLGWLLPSAEPRLQSCTSVLSSAELNCQALMAKMFLVQPDLLRVGFSRRILVFSLGVKHAPCMSSLDVIYQLSRKHHRLFHWPCHFETDWFL